MQKALTVLLKLERGLIIVFFGVMVLSMTIQVVNREVFHRALAWAEELSRYCLIYMVFLAAEATLRENKQLSMEAIRIRMPGLLRRGVDYFSKAVIVAFSITVMIGAVPLVERQISNGQKAAGLGIPMYIPYLALLVSFVAITVVQTVQLLFMVMSDISGRKG